MIAGNEKITGMMLCRLRMAKGITQKMIAANLQMTQQAYCKLEHRDIIQPSILNSVLNAMRSNMEELAIINSLCQKDNYSH